MKTTVGEGGVELEAHLRQAAKSGFDVSAMLHDKEPPAELCFVWGMFCELSLSRPYALGPLFIPYTEIDAYCRLHSLQLATYEVDLLKQLDNEWMKHYARPSGTKPRGEVPAGEGSE